jgi:type IV pilus assembly protein PilQ
MIARSRKLIYDTAVALFLLVVFAGCAQTRANIKDGDTAENSGAAIIQAIKVSADASLVEVFTNKPLSYTYYKTDEPPKAVIDLAQTDPGAVEKIVEVNSGNIKRIEVAKHEFTGGFLSRIEVILEKGEDFSVSTDSVDKGKLLIKFAIPPIEEKQISGAKEETKSAPAVTAPATEVEVKPIVTQQQAIKPEEKPAPAVEAAAGKGTPQIQTESKEEKKPANEATKEANPAAETKASPAFNPKVLRAVTAGIDGIEINVTGGVDNFNAFKLTRPDRVVLDLPGVKSGLVAKSTAINKFGVGQARLGIYPDKVRIVFDAAKGSLPPYQVIKSMDVLKVLFAEVPGLAAEQAWKEPVKEPVKPAIKENKATAAGISAIEAIDFKIVDDYSQIAIKIDGDCNVGRPVKVAGGLSLTINNCKIPDKFRRMIDTSAFPGVVKMITPYQVKVKKGNEARILVKLRQAASSALRQEGDTVYWNIKNPEIAKAPAAVSRPVKRMPEIAQGEKVYLAEQTATVQERQQSAALKPGEKKVYTGRRVSLEFSDADIRKILQLIAEVSNLNFLIGDDVSGTISIKLVNVPWDQALEVILDSKGLEKKQVGNIMYIKPRGKFKSEEQEAAEAKVERERRMELKTRLFDINYAAVADIEKQFDKLKSDRGTISQDARTNRVIVTDIDDRLDKMAVLLKALDTPEKQVMIEARIVEATSTFIRDVGVQWGIHWKDPTGTFLGMQNVDVGFGGANTVTPPLAAGLPLVTGPGGAAGFTFGKLGTNAQVDLQLSAAATIGQVKVISSPKVLTLNNKTAKISQGTSIPYQSTSAEGTTTIFVEADLTLEVTPHVAADGTISMKIKATNNSPGASIQSTAGNAAPEINKKEAETEVQVMNGETVVIGGIYQDSEDLTDAGVPWLMDIPLLGWLFKSNHHDKTKSELLIFITPKLVT